MPKNTPIMVGMHVPPLKYTGMKNGVLETDYDFENAKEFWIVLLNLIRFRFSQDIHTEVVIMFMVIISLFIIYLPRLLFLGK